MGVEVFESKDIQSQPSYEPATEESAAIAYEYVTRNILKQTNVCIPAVVIEYDRTKNIATVQPAIKESTAVGKFVERSKIKAPVMQPAGGGFIMSLPLSKGDTGWLLTNDRDISLFKQQKTVINANTYRSHSIEDSFFIPDYVSGFGEKKENEKNVVIRSIKGASEIVISENNVKVSIAKKEDNKKEANNKDDKSKKTSVDISLKDIKKTVENINLDCKTGTAVFEEKNSLKTKDMTIEVTNSAALKCPKIKITGECTVESNSTIILSSSKIKINGNLEVSGEVKASSVEASSVKASDVEASNVKGSSVEAGGISLSSHVHSGVQSGGGSTGAPQ